MKKAVTLFGDYFFYAFAVFSSIIMIASAATPVRGILLDEFKRFADPKGKDRAISVFNKKLAIAGITRDKFKPRIKVLKRNRELQVLSDTTIVAHYPVGLGRSTVGAKMTADDRKTPEGEYYICKKDDDNRFHLFLQLNYPSMKDAERGSIQRVIQNSEREKITAAWKNKEIPPSDTALGGPVGIHGFGAESSWTIDGSISMHNAHIEEVFWNVEEGTPVAVLQ